MTIYLISRVSSKEALEPQRAANRAIRRLPWRHGEQLLVALPSRRLEATEVSYNALLATAAWHRKLVLLRSLKRLGPSTVPRRGSEMLLFVGFSLWNPVGNGMKWV